MAIVLNSGNIIPTVRYGASQNVAIGSGSLQSTVIGTTAQATSAPDNILIRLSATSNCRIAVGTNPTATSTSTYLPSGVVEFIEIVPGERVAVIQDTASGTLSITQCII